jgi:hypothetical protein
MLLTHAPYQASIERQIQYAQDKLMMTDVPLSLRATSYLRLGCSAMRQSHQSKNMRYLVSPAQIEQVSYLDLLRQLIQQSPTWWNTCYVGYEGLLKSRDPKIQHILQPLNTFMQGYLQLLVA